MSIFKLLPGPHLDDVHGHVQGADDAGVAIGQAVLDVVERRVHQHSVVVPRRRLRRGTRNWVIYRSEKSNQQEVTVN